MLEWVRSALKRLGMSKQERGEYAALRKTERYLAAALDAGTGGIKLSDVEKAYQKRAQEMAQEQSQESQKAKEKPTTQVTGKLADARYKLSENAEQEVDKALSDKYYGGDVKLTEMTPSILLGQKGVKNLPMVMKASHIRENVFTEKEAKANGLSVKKGVNYHGLGKTLFLKVIDDLDNVTEAYRGTKNADNSARRENYFLLISQQKDSNGETINVPVFINEKAIYNRVAIDTNKIATVFARDGLNRYIREQISKGNLVRIKKRNTQGSESTAPIAANYAKDVSTTIIREKTEKSTQNAKKVEENFSERDKAALEDKKNRETPSARFSLQ